MQFLWLKRNPHPCTFSNSWRQYDHQRQKTRIDSSAGKGCTMYSIRIKIKTFWPRRSDKVVIKRCERPTDRGIAWPINKNIRTGGWWVSGGGAGFFRLHQRPGSSWICCSDVAKHYSCNAKGNWMDGPTISASDRRWSRWWCDLNRRFLLSPLNYNQPYATRLYLRNRGFKTISIQVLFLVSTRQNDWDTQNYMICYVICAKDPEL